MDGRLTRIKVMIAIAIIGIVVSFLGRAGVIDIDGGVVALLDYFNVSTNTRTILGYIFNSILILLICYSTIKRFVRERAEARIENKPWKRWSLRVLCFVVWLPFIFVFGMALIKS